MLSKLRAARVRTDPPNPWGIDLLDSGLSTLWYPCDWESVADDELVLLIPTLTSRTGASRQPHDAAARIAQRISGFLDAPQSFLFSDFEDPPRPQSLVALIEGSGALSSFRKYPEVLATADPSKRYLAEIQLKAPGRSSARRIGCFDTLCALATMDRMLYDAMPPPVAEAPVLLDRLELPDILLATILTRIHGAYVYPEIGYAHELLTAGAWLGVVLTGRPAIMPEDVADVLVAYLDPDALLLSPPEKRIRQIFEFCSQQLGGTERLLHSCAKVRAKGPLIYCAWPAKICKKRPTDGPWNSILVDQIDTFLTEREA